MDHADEGAPAAVEKVTLPTVLVRSAKEAAEIPASSKTHYGRSAILASGAKVWLADKHTPNGGNHVMFTNADGTQTHICVSDDAMEALVDLWSTRDDPTFQWIVQLGDRTNDSTGSTSA